VITAAPCPPRDPWPGAACNGEDEPDWKDVLRVVPIELDGRNVSAN
jgi:hypothetical protein